MFLSQTESLCTYIPLLTKEYKTLHTKAYSPENNQMVPNMPYPHPPIHFDHLCSGAWRNLPTVFVHQVD